MSWTAKILACKTVDAEQAFSLTFRSDDEQWESADPKGIIDPDQGSYVERMIVALPVTGCFDNNREVLMLNVHLSAMSLDDTGTGNIIGVDHFTWRCASVV